MSIEPTPIATLPASSLVDDGGFFGATGIWATRPGQLLVSTDRGATWVVRSLVPAVNLGIDQPAGLSSVFVLDASHAWSASPGPGSTPYGGQGPLYDHLYVIVNRSSDGGRTWRAASVPGDWGDSQPELTFADPLHGYLLLAGLRGGGASAVFATGDGGATWREMGGADILGSIFGVTGTATLWSGNQGDAGPVARPILDVSRDRGRTWADARLPGLVGDIYVTDTLVGPPVISGLAGAVAVDAAGRDPATVRFYRTSDGGRSWREVARVAQNDNASISVAVIDATGFVELDPEAGVVRSSNDGGLTWSSAPMTGLGQPSRLRFWDPGQGAAIVQLVNGPSAAAGIFRTSDGGQIWQSISPEAEPLL